MGRWGFGESLVVMLWAPLPAVSLSFTPSSVESWAQQHQEHQPGYENMGTVVGLSIKTTLFLSTTVRWHDPPTEGILSVRALIYEAKSETARYFTKKHPKTQFARILSLLGRRDLSLCFKRGLLGGGWGDPDYPHEGRRFSSLRQLGRAARAG